MMPGVVNLHVAQCVGRELAVFTHKPLHHLVGLHVTLQVTLLGGFIRTSGDNIIHFYTLFFFLLFF